MTSKFNKTCKEILEESLLKRGAKALGKLGAVATLAAGLGSPRPNTQPAKPPYDVNKPAKEVYDVNKPAKELPDVNKPAKEVRDKLTPVKLGSERPSVESVKEHAESLKSNPEALKSYIKSLPKPLLHEVTGLNQEVPNSVLGPIFYASVKNGFKKMNIIAAVMYRESRFGKALNKAGKGDKGHGHGLMQIDDRSHKSWLDNGTWSDPYDNVDYGTKILKTNEFIFKNNIFRALAAYNCGIGNVRKAMADKKSAEAYTAHGDYASKVLKYAKNFKK